MKKKLLRSVLMAYMAMFSFLCLSLTAQAAPIQPVNSGGDFAVGSVVEVPGTYPPITYVYGGSTRAAATADVEFGMLTSTDGFATNPTWTPLSGVVGYAANGLNYAIVTCPAGKTCGGYKAFYNQHIYTGGGVLYRCTGLVGAALSGCSLWLPTPSFSTTGGLVLTEDGNTLIVGRGDFETYAQIFSVDVNTSVATKLSACSDAGAISYPAGLAGTGANRYLYVWHNDEHHRFSWNGSTCTGPRTKVDGSMGWDNAVNSVGDGDFYSTVGGLTGSFYLSREDGSFFISKKDAVCNDSFISGVEKCDPSNPNPLNGQTCTSIPGGFTGGTLACDALTCNWNTSACSSSVSCGNGIKEGAEQCDGADMGGKTCTSELGEGWSGALSCASCLVDTTGCSYGWGVKNLSGACTLGGDGLNQVVSFSGGTCAAEYWPIGAVSATNLKWLATAGKALTINVVDAGAPTMVMVPQGVSHEEVNDKGNKYEMNAGGVGLSVEGTIYAAMWKSYPIMLFTCTEGSIKLSFSSTPIAAINVDGTSGRLPAGYGVEVNVQTGEVTKAPYKLDGSGGDGGAGGDGGTGGSDGGAGGGDDGGCSCTVPGKQQDNTSIFLLLAVVLLSSRRLRRC
jgi:hypothetical protein